MVSRDFRKIARESLQGNWGTAIGGVVVLNLIIIILSCFSSIPLLGFIFIIGSLVIAGPVWYGTSNYFNKLVRKENPQFEDFFKGFNAFGKSVAVYLLMVLKLIGWTLLLYVPGLIKSFAYSMTLFIRIDYPELSANECIKLSNEMMKGYKWRLFCLCFSFIGWILLSILTLGIGYLWLMPYMAAAQAAFYQNVKQNYEASKGQPIQPEYSNA